MTHWVNNWFDLVLHSDMGGSAGSPETIAFILLLSFVVGHLIAWVYMWTHQVLSYSQTFVASIVVLPPIVAMMMSLMSGSIVVAFGLLAVFAVVRFRNVLKDTRDTSFVLWAIVEGMSVGTMRYTSAVIGVLFIGLVLLYLRTTSFGSRHRFDAGQWRDLHCGARVAGRGRAQNSSGGRSRKKSRRSGINMEEIAQYLGHTTSKITYSHYARYSPDYLRKAASALE